LFPVTTKTCASVSCRWLLNCPIVSSCGPVGGTPKTTKPAVAGYVVSLVFDRIRALILGRCTAIVAVY
jgi:hypothetical protein